VAIKVNTDLIKEIKKYGAFDISACFNCGNCTAVCPLSKEDLSFPRKLIRYGQLGMENKIESSLEPWLCYYCGECSDTCPRQAEPGEYMMSIRRYLIARYDFTGISRFFYKNKYAQILLSIALFIVLLFYFFKGYKGDFGKLAGKIEFLFPVYVTIAIIGYLWNMYRNVILKTVGKFKISFKPKDIFELFYHGFTQINFTRCEKTDWLRWISHLLVMSGYTLTLLISNLHLFEPLDKQYTVFNFISLLIWYSSISIVVGGLFMVVRRVFKTVPSSKFSTPSDWLFVTSLFLIGASMFTTLIANISLGMGNHTLELIYKTHMSIEIVWIVLIVPFTKWIHIFFRPLAIYFVNVKK